ncbi:hypothetical protein ACOMHN_044712 [Nucella lapillus]
MLEMPSTQMLDRVTVSAKENDSQLADFLNNITAILWYAIPPVLIIFGTFGNVMIVVVMRGLRASQSTACLSVYFTALAVSDQCLLLVSVLWYWVDMGFSWPPSFFVYDLLCTIPTFLWYASSLTSAWFLVAMTYQRVTSVVAPHRVGLLCTVRRGKIIIAAIVILATLINVHFMFTWTYWYEYRECQAGAKYVEFIDMFTLLDIFLASVIPFILLGAGNAILVRQVIRSMRLSRKMRGNPDQQSGDKVAPMTVTLILTSAAFFVLTFPTCVFDAYRRTFAIQVEDEYLEAKLDLVETVTLFLWSSVSATNFYLYLLSGKKFREEAKRCLSFGTK